MASARVERVGNRRCTTPSPSTPLRGRTASAGEGRLERRIVAEDRSLQLLQTGAGLDPEFLAERRRARLYVSAPLPGDRFGRGRASAARAGPHGRGAPQRGSRARRRARRRDRVQGPLRYRLSNRRQAELLQTGDLGLGEGLEREVCKRRYPPECECVRSVRRGAFRTPFASSRRPAPRRIEETDVESFWRDAQHVARRPA